ncbi:Asp23/Gls24 family envelope stress response protein [Pediococcus siamensis]|uniref:Asp23/Gls24 family envelope stress response protein n=1 Tax=Pediococcus siamensis TaxID=381829 RepID=UPI0039A3612D
MTRREQMTNETNTQTSNSVRGELTYDDKVVQKIVGIALEEIDGLLTVDGGFFSNIKEKLVNTDDVHTGINAEVGKKQVALDMDIVAEYGKDIEDIYDQMKTVITREVKEMTHLDVIELNVNVVDVKTREEYEADSETVQDKVKNTAEKTGDFASRKTDQAKRAMDKGRRKVDEAREPRVE